MHHGGTVDTKLTILHRRPSSVTHPQLARKAFDHPTYLDYRLRKMSIRNILATTAFLSSALLSARADPVPQTPDTGITGQTCTITWEEDTTGNWAQTAIELMTGDNYAMVHLTSKSLPVRMEVRTGSGWCWPSNHCGAVRRWSVLVPREHTRVCAVRSLASKECPEPGRASSSARFLMARWLILVHPF